MQSTLPFTPHRSSSSPAPSPAGPQQSSSVGVAIASLEAADEALAEIAQLDARERAVQAECDKDLKRIREQYSARMRVTVAGVLMPFADRRAALMTAITLFAEAHKAGILEKGSRSRQLNHGTIGWRESRATLVPAVEGAPTAGNAALLDKLVAHLRLALAKFTGMASKIACSMKVTVSHDKPALKKLLENKEITAAELRKVGFVIGGGEDTLYVDVKAADVSSLSAEALPPATE